MYPSSTPPAGKALAMGLSHLEEDTQQLISLDYTDVAPEALGDAVVEIGVQIRRLQAAQATAADAYASSGSWAGEASRSAKAWINGKTNDSAAVASRMLSAGAAMRAHPVMANAFRCGDVSGAHLQILADAHRDFPQASPGLERIEADLVEVAKRTTPRRFGDHLRAWCHRLDPEGVQAEERKRDRDAYLRVSTLMYGMVRVDGMLPADIGSQLVTTLESMRRAIAADQRSGEQQAAREIVGHDAFGNPIYADEAPSDIADRRMISARNLEALKKLLDLAAIARNDDGSIAIPSVNGYRPTIHVTIPLESLLEDSRERAAGWLERFGVPAAAISSATAERLLCDASMEPQIITRDGRLAATLPRTRSISHTLRRAVQIRDHHCRIPGCHRRIDEVHHVVFYSHGGLTVMSNLAGLCWYHHHQIHHEPWTLTGDANHELTLTNTHTGRTWTSHPPPQRE